MMLTRLARFLDGIQDYCRYVWEEIKNEGKDEDEMIAWELRSTPIDDTLKGVKAKAKSYASRIRKGKK